MNGEQVVGLVMTLVVLVASGFVLHRIDQIFKAVEESRDCLRRIANAADGGRGAPRPPPQAATPAARRPPPPAGVAPVWK